MADTTRTGPRTGPRSTSSTGPYGRTGPYSRTGPHQRSGGKHPPTGWWGKLWALMRRLREATRSEPDLSSPLVQLIYQALRGAGWVAFAVSAWIAFQVLVFIFANPELPPPRPTGFDAELKNVALFYIFAICLGGPIVLLVAIVAVRMAWFSVQWLLQSQLPGVVHVLVSPLMCLALMFAIQSSQQAVNARFWRGYYFVAQNFEDAAQMKLKSTQDMRRMRRGNEQPGIDDG